MNPFYIFCQSACVEGCVFVIFNCIKIFLQSNHRKKTSPDITLNPTVRSQKKTEQLLLPVNMMNSMMCIQHICTNVHQLLIVSIKWLLLIPPFCPRRACFAIARILRTLPCLSSYSRLPEPWLVQGFLLQQTHALQFIILCFRKWWNISSGNFRVKKVLTFSLTVFIFGFLLPSLLLFIVRFSSHENICRSFPPSSEYAIPFRRLRLNQELEHRQLFLLHPMNAVHRTRIY